MRSIAAVSLLLCSFMQNGAAAAAPSFQGFTKLLYDRSNFEVQADGSATETREWAITVLAEQGIASANRTTIEHSAELQTAEITSAYTLKADGRRIDAPSANFQVSSDSGRGEAAPMFSDIQSQSVVFPDVAVGDTVVFAYRRVDKQPMFPGHFSYARGFSKFEIIDELSIRITAPRSLALKVLARGVEGGPKAADGGRQRWEWRYHNTELAQPEPGAVSAFDQGPLIIASTFKSYGAIAAAYEARAKDKARVTPRLRELAEALTAGIDTPREQARVLYEWVAKNIRFAGHCVGKGSVVPHEAEQVLSNRLGDCKDHAALLQALLAARGIVSTPALIGSGNAYKLPEVPAVELFNHVVNYLPGLDLYLDASVDDIPFGSLPASLYGKPTLHTANFKAGTHTPPPPMQPNRPAMHTELEFLDDGSARGRAEIDILGPAAASARAQIGYLAPHLEGLAMRNTLSRNGFNGNGSFERPAADERLEQTRYAANFTVSDVLDLPGPNAWVIRSPFGSFIPADAMRSAVNLPARSTDYSCGSSWAAETLSLKLPSGLRLLALPKDRAIRSRWATYTAQYRSDGDTLIVKRELSDRTPGPVCAPQDADDYKSFAAEVLKDLRAPLLYE